MEKAELIDILEQRQNALKFIVEKSDELLKAIHLGALTSLSWVIGRIQEIRDLATAEIQAINVIARNQEQQDVQGQHVTEDEIKTHVIEQHIKRLPPGTKTRQQIITGARMLADWVRVDLSKALGCGTTEVPGKLADWLGFPWTEPNKTAAEKENTEK